MQVGTGYSFTDDGGFSTTETEVAENLYICLTQFFTLLPNYQKNDFYITGEVTVVICFYAVVIIYVLSLAWLNYE